MTCPKCGRQGRCDECCCIHPDHDRTPRLLKAMNRTVCPLCHHDLKGATS